MTSYYHGTSAVLVPGNVIVTGAECGKQNWDGTDNTVVWLHDNHAASQRYGEHVYRVEPVDWVVNFSEDAGHIEEGLPENEWEYITPSAQVIEKSLDL